MLHSVFIFLKAYGQAGVVHLVRILEREIKFGMASLGVRTVEELTPELVSYWMRCGVYNIADPSIGRTRGFPTSHRQIMICKRFITLVVEYLRRKLLLVQRVVLVMSVVLRQSHGGMEVM